MGIAHVDCAQLDRDMYSALEGDPRSGHGSGFPQPADTAVVTSDRPTVSSSVLGFWKRSQLQPAQIAIVDPDGRSWTAGELLATANRYSNAMASSGLRPGANVAICMRNSAQLLALVLAASQVGVHYTMINSHFLADEVAYIVADASSELMFVDDYTYEIGRGAAEAAHIDPSKLICRAVHGKHRSLEDWVGTASDTLPPARVTGLPMLYTSGTSGRPKGVKRSVLVADPDADAVRRTLLLRRYGIDPATRATDGTHLVTSPLYHAAPLASALAALHLGDLVVLMDRFDAREMLQLIDRHRVTWTHVVPTMMARLAALPEHTWNDVNTSSLKLLIHAGAPCPVGLKRTMLARFGPVVWEYYSSTEGGGTVIGPEEWLEHPGSVGRPWEGAEIRILDDACRELPTGATGTIFMLDRRGFEYHNDPQKTGASRCGDFVTAGDLGWLSVDGYLYIADRRSDLILTGGVNIYPSEIESVLDSHPSVAEVAVVGVADPDLGQVIHADVQPVDPSVDTVELIADLRDFASTRLSSQKRPHSYHVRDSMPRNEAGKLLRRVIRAEAQERRSRAPSSPGHVLPNGPKTPCAGNQQAHIGEVHDG